MRPESKKYLWDATESASAVLRFAELAGQIPDLNRAVGMRNVLVHAYAQTDHLLVWGLIDGPLPKLMADLESLP